MPLSNLAGVSLPRWRHKDHGNLHADRIQANDGKTLALESGAKVDLTDELKATGPGRVGDFWTQVTDDKGAPTGEERLFAGADFQSDASPIAHAWDIPEVSADEQPGYTMDEPTSGSPDDPAAKTVKEKQDAAKPDPMVATHEREAAERAAEQESHEG